MSFGSNCAQRCRWIRCIRMPFLFASLATGALVFALLSATVIQSIDLVHRNVTVGKVNAALTLGTFGYCLDVSGNQTCSAPDIPYVISNSQVLAQIETGSIITGAFSIVIPLAAFGALGASIFAYFSQGSPNDGLRKTATYFAGFSALSAAVGLAFGLVFIVNSSEALNSAGSGFWLIVTATIILGFFACFAERCVEDVGEKEEGHPDSDDDLEEEYDDSLKQLDPRLAQLDPRLAGLDPRLAQLDPRLAQLDPRLAQLDPRLAQLDPQLAQLDPQLAQLDPQLDSRYGPPPPANKNKKKKPSR